FAGPPPVPSDMPQPSVEVRLRLLGQALVSLTAASHAYGAHQHRRQPGTEDRCLPAVAIPRGPGRNAVSPLRGYGGPLGFTDRAWRGEHPAHRLVGRITSGPDLLCRRKLDRVGPL